MSYLPGIILKTKELEFVTPNEIVKKYQPVSAIHVPHPISWADEERDLTAWLGNELQKEAFDKLYKLKDRMRYCTDSRMLKDWTYLQTNDHLYYMCTKFFSDGEVHKSFNPYANPYEAFINYMNVISDFSFRLNKMVPNIDNQKELPKVEKIMDEHTNNSLNKVKEVKKNIKENLTNKRAKGTPSKEKIVKPIKPAEKKVSSSDIKKR